MILAYLREIGRETTARIGPLSPLDGAKAGRALRAGLINRTLRIQEAPELP